jgi:hypothetical protein
MFDVTQLLSHIESGDPTAREQLLTLVYNEVRRLAGCGGKNVSRETLFSYGFFERADEFFSARTYLIFGCFGLFCRR